MHKWNQIARSSLNETTSIQFQRNHTGLGRTNNSKGFETCPCRHRLLRIENAQAHAGFFGTPSGLINQLVTSNLFYSSENPIPNQNFLPFYQQHLEWLGNK